jgi:photosystem II stability/assembly factor-like uncharacterized protein
MKRVCLTIAVAIVVAACFSYASSGWLKYKSPTEKDINAVTFVNENTGWAVGYWGEILRYRNGRWNINYTWPTQYFQDVDFGTANFGLAVGDQGNGAVFNGTKWKFAGMETKRNIWGVVIPPGQNSVAWAVGERGTVFRWTGGRTGSWSSWNIGTLAALHDVHFSSPNDGWLCGNNGRVYHFAESEWTQVSASTTTNFHCIYALSQNNVWAGGASGHLFHYEGVSWVRVATPTTAAIREMSFTGPTEGWAACDDGVILRYDGVSWEKVKTKPATSESFSGLFMLGGTHGWAVGTNGTIYEYRNFPGVDPASVGRIKALMR